MSQSDLELSDRDFARVCFSSLSRRTASFPSAVSAAGRLPESFGVLGIEFVGLSWGTPGHGSGSHGVHWSACPNSSAQRSDESSASTKQQVLFLNTADDGKHVSIKVGREIVITLQTIGPGQYETPQISSSSIRFKGSYFPREQNPGGPRQVYRFVAETVGEAKVEIPHSERNAVYRIIVQVKAN